MRGHRYDNNDTNRTFDCAPKCPIGGGDIMTNKESAESEMIIYRIKGVDNILVRGQGAQRARKIKKMFGLK